MNDRTDAYRTEWWERNLEELDLEIGRLALLCGVRLLDRGVIDRVLQHDDSICASRNPRAFAKLHELLKMHFVIRQKTADELGQRHTAAIENYVVERLRRVFPDMGNHWPPA
jgi:hypothetical protein